MSLFILTAGLFFAARGLTYCFDIRTPARQRLHIILSSEQLPQFFLRRLQINMTAALLCIIMSQAVRAAVLTVWDAGFICAFAVLAGTAVSLCMNKQFTRCFFIRNAVKAYFQTGQ